MSIVEMSSGLRKPLECIVGVHSTSLSLMRTVMLPSFAAANPLSYRRRPISQISCLTLWAFTMLLLFRYSVCRRKFVQDRCSGGSIRNVISSRMPAL